jgi:hypothetical protein
VLLLRAALADEPLRVWTPVAREPRIHVEPCGLDADVEVEVAALGVKLYPDDRFRVEAVEGSLDHLHVVRDF